MMDHPTSADLVTCERGGWGVSNTYHHPPTQNVKRKKISEPSRAEPEESGGSGAIFILITLPGVWDLEPGLFMCGCGSR